MEDGIQAPVIEPKIPSPAPRVPTTTRASASAFLQIFANQPRLQARCEAEKLISSISKSQQHGFVARPVLALDGVEELQLGTRRLKPGTNYKRSSNDDHAAIARLHNLQFIARQSTHDLGRARRAFSEETGLAACARERDLTYKGDDLGPRSAAGDAGDMSERSSGTNKQTRNSLQAPIAQTAESGDGADTSGTLEDIQELAGDQAPAFVVCGKAVRNTRQISAQKYGDSANAPEKSKEKNNAFSTNARDQQPATNSNDVPTKPKSTWGFGKRYRDPSKNSLPQYGPTAPVPLTPRQADPMKPEIPGTFKPRTTYDSLSSPLQPTRSTQGPKPFDRKTSSRNSCRDNGNPLKPQRAKGNNGSSTSPIEVTDESPQPTMLRATSSTSREQNRLGRTSTLGDSRRIPEQQQAEKCIRVKKPRKRNSSFEEKHPSAANRHATEKHPPVPTAISGKKPSVIRGSQRFQSTFVQERQENADDPIVDDEVIITSSSIKPKPTTNRNTYPEIQIRSSLEVTTKSSPEGDAHPNSIQPSQPDRKAKEPTGSLTKSPFFVPSAQGSGRPRLQQGRDQVASTSSLSRSSQPQTKKDLDPDRDELALDDIPHAHPRQTQRGPSTKPRERVLRKPSSSFTLDSSDEDVGREANIRPTAYKSSSAKPTNVLGDTRYEVSRFFPQSSRWLQENTERSGTLEYDKNDSIVFVVDGDSRYKIPGTQVEKIEHAASSSKMVIHQSRSRDGASNVYIEFRTSGLCQQFYEKFVSIHSNISNITKLDDHLEKVFNNVLPKLLNFKPPQAQVADEPDDIKLAKAISQRNQKRLGENNSQHSSRNGELHQEDESGNRELRKPKGLARRMEGNPDGPGSLNNSTHRRQSNEVSSSEFYGGANRADLKETSSRETRSRKVPGDSLFSPTPSRQPRLKRSPTPDPPRWTVENRGWEEKYWPNSNSVIYPSKGKNKASVDRQDIERLDEGEFLNDNLIVFYLRWLEERLGRERPDLAKRIYFHNTFFYERLTKSTKGRAGSINYEAVARWTAKVDLLEYDYIVVPVNETVHWYVAIICNAPKLLRESPGKVKSPSPHARSREDNQESRTVENGPISKQVSPEQSPQSFLKNDLPVAEMEDMSLGDGEQSLPVSETELDRASSLANGNTETYIDDPPPANITSDILPGPNGPAAFVLLEKSSGVDEVKQSQIKKSKRKSGVAPGRKYSLSEPRIITLDSLGMSHSPTCTNLKKYLLQEIKAKKNIDVKDPGHLGMTAKRLPQQNNHCDCGLFLLTYVEQFLKQPDEFIQNILQGQDPETRITIEDDDEVAEDKPKWPPASKLRNDIRDLLFRLQEVQAAEAEAEKIAKIRNKKAAKTPDKATFAPALKHASREVSTNSQASPSPNDAQTSTGNDELAEPPTKSKTNGQHAPAISSIDADVKSSDNHHGPTASETANLPRNEVRDNSQRTVSQPGLLTSKLLKATSVFWHAVGHNHEDNLVSEMNGARPSVPVYCIDDESTHEMDGNELHTQKLPKHDTGRERQSTDPQTKSKNSRSAKRPRDEVVANSQEKTTYQVLAHPHPYSSPDIEDHSEHKKGQHTYFRSPGLFRNHFSAETIANASLQDTTATMRSKFFSEGRNARTDGKMNGMQEHDISMAEDDEIQLISTTTPERAVAGPASAAQLDDEEEMLFSHDGLPSPDLLPCTPPEQALQPTNPVNRLLEGSRLGHISPAGPKRVKRDNHQGSPEPKRRKTLRSGAVTFAS